MEALSTDVARNLGIPVRSFRRAIDAGTIRGRRLSERKFMVPLGEEVYLRENWGTLSQLRQALRTEPNVRLAVLFGSTARGTATPSSDIDLMIDAAVSSRSALAGVANRLESKLGRPVQVIRIEEAEASPALLDSVVREGRVLVDREDAWAGMSQTGESSEAAELEESMERFLNAG